MSNYRENAVKRDKLVFIMQSSMRLSYAISLTIALSLLLPACSDMLSRPFKIPPLTAQLGLEPVGTMAINADAIETTTMSVTLRNDVDNADEMSFSNDGSTWSAWEAYATSKTWTMIGHGDRTVHGRFRAGGGTPLFTTDAIRVFAEEKLTASDGSAGDCYGGYYINTFHGSALSISSDGNSLVVGSWLHDVGSNPDQGSVYHYRLGSAGWHETIFTNSNGVANNGFGFSVSMSGDGNAFSVGSWYKNTSLDGAHTYRYSGSSWTETEHARNQGNQYGVATAISEDGLSTIVGAYGNGGVFLYHYNSTSWTGTWFSPSDLNLYHYGFHVAISGDGNIGVVGNPAANRVYAYRNTGSSWVEYILEATDGHTGIIFGRIVAISTDGNTIVTGAYRDSAPNANQGSVYLYRWNGAAWVGEKITASDGAANDYFGYSVSLSSDGTMLLVGAPAATVSGHAAQGAAYLYTWTGSAWTQRKITASDGAANDYYGYSVSLSARNHTVGISAPGKDSQKGVVYLY